jgi:hypothetical protein
VLWPPLRVRAVDVLIDAHTYAYVASSQLLLLRLCGVGVRDVIDSWILVRSLFIRPGFFGMRVRWDVTKGSRGFQLWLVHVHY